MSKLGNDIAQQDALSNAFLAIFGILLLLLVQVGLDNVTKRIEQQIYGKIPDFDPTWTGGPGAIAVWPRADMVVVLAPDVADLDVQYLSSTAPPPKPELGLWQGVQGQGRLYLIDRSEFPGQERVLAIRNHGKAPAPPIGIAVALDAATVGKGATSLNLAPGKALYIRLCPGGAAYASEEMSGRCP